MIIGFIGFGKVSKTLRDLIKSDDVEFVTSFEKRSIKTLENIKKANIEVLDTFEDVAINSDILISANSPKSALNVAAEYGSYSKGIYLDLNNISPKTTLEINAHVHNLVDGAIVGKIDSDNPILYLSGQKAEELLFLDKFIHTRVISSKVGDVSVLKMLRSSYTKTLSALLIESNELAKSLDLEEEFFEILSLTEGEEFRKKSLSRINNTLNSSKRKSEELNEIISFFENEDLTMVKAALKKLNQY